MRFETGSLVTARDREWIVQAESSEELLVLRPIGGTENETTGIYLPLEPDVRLAKFALPSPEDFGDYNCAQLLRDAAQLSLRSTTGPFRSFGKLAFQPRPYQLVPLVMALRQDPIRILIADDVGIGKTVESLLIAKELIERREAKRLAVLCPPHLAQQWHEELKSKFNIDAQVVLPSTVRKLERQCSYDESIFDVFPHVIVSIDFIKSDRRKDDFIRACPELVIVDEAHAVGYGGHVSSAQHRRHDLITKLSADQSRHLILVTATPHSGKEEAFRSLLRLLSEKFIDLPTDLSGEHNRKNRELVASYFIQRKRPDIEKYLGTDTHFPKRKVREESYLLSDEYRKLFEKVLNFTREFVSIDGGQTHQQRVRWWSALSLLRSLSSSPAAAVQTLRSRSSSAETSSTEDADQRGRIEVFDTEDIDDAAGDQNPGADIGDETSSRKLNQFAREAEQLFGNKPDTKLRKVEEIVKELLKDKFSPIIFCRFVATAPYVAEHLASQLGSRVQVKWVTGELAPAEREEVVASFDREKPRVLVATDCLSEGINLQDCFNSVIHYDLAWNPTRHEQREGRVDRFGQSSNEVRVVTIYGKDNQIDGIILDVLLQKQKSIRNDLGISIPVPVDADSVVEAIFEGLLLRTETGTSSGQQTLPGFDEYFKPKKEELHKKWEEDMEREKKSRALFAQHRIEIDDITNEVMQEVDAAVGADRLPNFIKLATKSCFGHIKASTQDPDLYELDYSESPNSLKDLLPNGKKYTISFDAEKRSKAEFIHRTHPLAEAISTYIFNSALDRFGEVDAKRMGVIRTDIVDTRTTMLLLRLRFQLSFKLLGQDREILAEQCSSLVFQGSPENPNWSDDTDLQTRLYSALPKQNVAANQAKEFLQKVIENYDSNLEKAVASFSKSQAELLYDSHLKVRRALNEKLGRSLKVEPLATDLLGAYIYLPVVS